MGQYVSNGGFVFHGHGTTPLSGDLEFFVHWGDEGIDNISVITSAQRDALISAAAQSQAAFDTAAGSVVSWYGFTGLQPSPGVTAAEKRDKIRATCRYGVGL